MNKNEELENIFNKIYQYEKSKNPKKILEEFKKNETNSMKACTIDFEENSININFWQLSQIKNEKQIFFLNGRLSSEESVKKIIEKMIYLENKPIKESKDFEKLKKYFRIIEKFSGLKIVINQEKIKKLKSFLIIEEF